MIERQDQTDTELNYFLIIFPHVHAKLMKIHILNIIINLF